MVDFSKFDGSEVRAWALKCQSYFKLVTSVPEEQKIALATMNFEGKALSWFENYVIDNSVVTWDQFIRDVSIRFDDLRERKIIAEFNKLKQTGSLIDYIEILKNLRHTWL